MGFSGRLRWLCLIAFALPLPAPLSAQSRGLPDELVLGEDRIIEVMLGGIPVRLEVGADEFGPPVINPNIAQRLLLSPTFRSGWRFGPVVVNGVGTSVPLDVGAGAKTMTVNWASVPVSRRADGVIGVHDLPYRLVTFELGPPGASERVQRFALKRRGGKSNGRLGTEIDIGKQRMAFVFSLSRAENLVTAPTANFIATHHEGGFEERARGQAFMRFNVYRPTQIMRIAYPIFLGELEIDRFAVRFEDYGTPSKVGTIEPNDPRFDKDTIYVTRRKGLGKPDRLTRLGRDQIAHCSRLTYDLKAMEARLSCADKPVAGG